MTIAPPGASTRVTEPAVVISIETSRPCRRRDHRPDLHQTERLEHRDARGVRSAQNQRHRPRPADDDRDEDVERRGGAAEVEGLFEHREQAERGDDGAEEDVDPRGGAHAARGRGWLEDRRRRRDRELGVEAIEFEVGLRPRLPEGGRRTRRRRRRRRRSRKLTRTGDPVGGVVVDDGHEHGRTRSRRTARRAPTTFHLRCAVADTGRV